MNPQIHGLLLLYIVWLAYNFKEIGNRCIEDIFKTIHEPQNWRWEPFIAGGPFLFMFAVRRIYIEQGSNWKQNLLLFSVFLAYMMFIMKMAISCSVEMFQNIFYVLCLIISITISLELYNNYALKTSKLI